MAAVLLFGAGLWATGRLDVPPQFWASDIETVDVDGRQLRLVHVGYADGLRNTPSLGALDGALFVLPETMSAGHGMGMDRVLIPLDVAFFDPAGQFIDRHTMALCTSGSCPGYYPRRAWQFAIEAPAGALAWMKEGSVLRR